MRINRIAVVVLLVASFVAPGHAKPTRSGSAVRVKQKITPFELPHRENGRLVWTVKGAVAHILENQDIILEMPRVHIVAVEGKPGRDITAETMTVTDGRNTMNFKGDVKIISTDGASLYADELTWKVDAQEATTTSHVTIRRGRMDLSGDGLYAQAKLNKFKVYSNVKLVVLPKQADRSGNNDVSAAKNGNKVGSGKPVTITSKGSMTFANGVAVFVGRPKVISGTATLVCDRLDVYMEAETETIKKAVAEGNVTLTSEEFNADCGKAVWIPDADYLKLFTKVVIADRTTANVMRTELAYLNPESNRIRCIGPATVTFRIEKNKDGGKERKGQ